MNGVILKLFLVTWNVAEQDPPPDLNTLLQLPPPLGQSLPDLYIIGLQEIGSLRFTKWKPAFKKALAEHGYKKVKSNRLYVLSGIMIQVFALEKHLEFINKVETGSIALGIAKILGNKGATSVRLNLYNMPTCFVNLHLAAHEKGFNERLDQMLYAERYQSFTKTEVDTIFKNDLVFWLGDLNFRLHQDLNLSVEDIKDHIREKQLDKLFEHDEINRMMKNGGFFQKLQEADIKFPPSFKFKLRTNDYVTNRRPAWTDRILFRDSEKVNITPISYKSVEEYMVSDHKPVIGEFEISIKV